MKIFLAPMEGLTDFHMRNMLTRIGGFDACVTEFIRVTDRLHPARVFFHACPELHTAGKTAAGTPVHLQLLGSDPDALADNAARAAELGAPAIDLNFGCPAKTVNRHRGGAVLLDEPETVHAIVAAVRRAVPGQIPVSAKMRLGMRDHSRMLENALGIEAAGADTLVVHARTKEDGYRPPAHWEAIARIGAAVKLPLMANGEIWTVDDARRCQQVSGCNDLMLGRGAISHPVLALELRGEQVIFGWPEIVHWLAHFLDAMQASGNADSPDACAPAWTEQGAIGRYKQWLGMLVRNHEPARRLFDQTKTLRSLPEIQRLLHVSLAGSAG